MIYGSVHPLYLETVYTQYIRLSQVKSYGRPIWNRVSADPSTTNGNQCKYKNKILFLPTWTCWLGCELLVYFLKVGKLVLDVPTGGPFIQKSILKNRCKFDHVARRSTVWRYTSACWVSRSKSRVGCRLANLCPISALNEANPANRALSTPRDRFRGIGLRHFMWKQFDRLCERSRTCVGHSHGSDSG